MPRFDGMGPEGKGPQSGRGLGKCNADKKRMAEHTDDENPKETNNLGLGRRRRNQRRGKAN